MARLEARVVSASEFPLWDHLVLQSGQGTVFQSSAWITTAAKFLDLDYAIIGVYNNSDLVGGCSFYFQNVFRFLQTATTDIPLTPYGGFVIPVKNGKKVRESENRESEIFSLVLEQIASLCLYSVSLVNGPALTDIRPLTWKGWKTWVYYAYVISLDNDLFSSISYGARRSIRKAQKTGITVKKEYSPNIYWKLSVATYEKQNMKVPFQKEYLFRLMDMLIRNNLGEMWIAEMPSGEAASAVFIVYDAHMAYGWVGANDPHFKDTGVVSLLLFEIITDLKKRGFHDINIMAGNTPHLAAFYTTFNPRLIPYYHVGKKCGLTGYLKGMVCNKKGEGIKAQ